MKRIFGTLLVLLCIIGIASGDTLFEINKHFVRHSADGKTLLVDTTGNTGWTWLLKTKRGVLKPNKYYRAEFQCKGMFHVLCRPLNVNHGDQDTLRLNVSGTAAGEKLVFNSGYTPNASFQIHVFKEMKGEIAGFKLTQTGFDQFIPVQSNAVPWQGELKNVPTGAKEFEVELPENSSGATILAADFGVNAGSADNTAALNRAVEHCRKTGAAKLKLDPGTYRMFAANPVAFTGMKDFEFDGRGATLVYSGEPPWDTPCFLVKDCERIALRNVNFDWDWTNDPLASIVRVERADNKTVDFRFVEYETFPRRDVNVMFLCNYDPKARSIGIPNGFNMAFAPAGGSNRSGEWLSGNLLRIKHGDARMFKPNQYFRMMHRYYGGFAVVMDSNRHLTLEDVNIYSCYGMALIVRGRQKYWQFRRVRVAPPPGVPRRPASCTADHYHIAQSCGFFKMEDCEFGYGNDDCVNLHDSAFFARKTGEKTIRTVKRESGSRNCRPGDLLELRNSDFSPTGFKAPIKVVRPIDEAKGIIDFEFDQPVPEASQEDGVLLGFNREYGCRNIIFRNNYFHHNRARGVLLMGEDITLENNRFVRNEQGAINIETGFSTAWSEGYGARNIVVRNNTFDTVNPLNLVKVGGKVHDILISTYGTRNGVKPYPILSDILFEGNTFKNSFGMIASIHSAHNVIFRNNTFLNSSAATKSLPYRAGFYVTNGATNVKIINNRWVASPYVPKPGVYAEPDAAPNLVIGGNTVENP